jgi:hypothetical protein
MTQKEIFYYLVCIALIVGGWFVSTYAGGIITGVGLSMLLAVLFGKRQARRSGERVDKQVKDILMNERD